MACGLCDGSEEIAEIGETTGHEFVISRHQDKDGTLRNYFNVDEYDAEGVLLLETCTPSFNCCPNCGDPL